MSKKLWNKCKCGVITDSDEEKCPRQGLKGNPEHQLKLVELSREELKIFLDQGKVYTKHHSEFQDKDPP